MGTLTTQELIAEVRSHLGERSDLTDARLVQALNLAQDRIIRGYTWREFDKAESGTFVITASATTDKALAFSDIGGGLDPRTIYSFRVITGDGRSRKLVRKSPRGFDEAHPEPEFFARGRPIEYVIWNDRFEFWRVPEEAWDYQIRYQAWPTALSTSTPTVVSDISHKDDLLLTLAVSWLFNSLSEYEKAGRFFGIFERMWKDAVEAEGEKPDLEISGERGPTNLGSNYWLDPFVKDVRTGP